MRRPACLFALIAVAAVSGCGDDDDRDRAPVGFDDPATSLTVVWEGNAKAEQGPIQIVLIGPSDQVVAKGRVADPTEHKTVFSFGTGGSMQHGYFLQVTRLGNRPIPACTRTVSVKHGFAVRATITPQSTGRCSIQYKG
jgi:hypothetical protein